jgi:hypothetical protein
MSNTMTQPQGPPIQAPAKRRWYLRLRFVIPATILGVLMAGAGLDIMMKDANTYQADLTTGSGDFRAYTSGNTTTSYQPDGFHLRITQAGGFGSAGVTTPGRGYEVTATVTRVSSPGRGAGFGPWCFNDQNTGYWMSLTADGQVTITYLKDGNETLIASGQAAAWGPGQTRKLTLVCNVIGEPSPFASGAEDEVSAFVNGVKAAEGKYLSHIPEIKATGFAGVVPEAADGPGEWIVTSFSRNWSGLFGL